MSIEDKATKPARIPKERWKQHQNWMSVTSDQVKANMNNTWVHRQSLPSKTKQPND